MERTTDLKDFIISVDYTWVESETFTQQEDLYNLVDKLANSVRSAFLSILTGFDGVSGLVCDPTPEVALDRSKIASVWAYYLWVQSHTAPFFENGLFQEGI